MSFAPYTPLSQRGALDVRPMSASPASAPKFTHHRLLEVNPDGAGAVTPASRGMNMAGFEVAHIQVIPSTGITPTAEVLFWSEAANKFVSEQTAISKAGPGAGIAFEFTVAVQGRVIFVKVTGTIGASKQVEVLVAGAELDHSR